MTFRSRVAAVLAGVTVLAAAIVHDDTPRAEANPHSSSKSPVHGHLPDEARKPGEGKGKGPSGKENGGSSDPKGRGPTVPLTLPPQASPVAGERINASPTRGTVTVGAPGGTPVKLEEGASVPIGSVVDASGGIVTLQTAPDAAGRPQYASFTGTRFLVAQKPGPAPLTEIVVDGSGLEACPKQSAGDSSSATGSASSRRARYNRAKRRLRSAKRTYSRVERRYRSSRTTRNRRSYQRHARKVRSARREFKRARALVLRKKLSGWGKGNFRTRGKHGAATVRGTTWATEERCEGTYFRVREGLVEIEDFTTRRTVLVSAGHSHLAPAPSN
ncbi:MAG: hypothetical protein ACR2NA_10405 [Solirubrobacterales bacterium]